MAKMGKQSAPLQREKQSGKEKKEKQGGQKEKGSGKEKGSEKQSAAVQILCRCFQEVRNPWSAALHLTCTVKDYVTTKPTCLAYFCMHTFARWCQLDVAREQQGHQLLTKKLKQLAFRTATGKHLAIFNVTADAFQLDADKEQFLDDVRRMVADDRMKDACHIISRLRLQEHFTLEEIVVPLFLQDKVNMVEDYLAGYPQLQQEFIAFLDRLCDRDFNISAFIDKMNVKGVRRDKMQRKTIGKLATRLLKLYNISPDTCPNITSSKALSGIKYWMHTRFIQKQMGQGPWRELVEEQVGNSEFLQKELVQLLACYGENEEALYWADRFSLPDDALLPAVLDLRQGKTAAAEGEGQMATSAPMELEEDWAKPSKNADSFHALSLSDRCISLVETVDQLEDFYTQIGKPGCVIGFDSEWRPGVFGRPEKIALLQIATADHVYLLDAICLQKVLDNKGLQKLASAIFCDENNLTLGYGLHTDLRILVKSFPTMKEVMPQMKRVVDIERLAKDVLYGGGNSKDKKQRETAEGMDDEAMEDGADNPDDNGSKKGLSHLVQTCLGKPLDKDEQMSDWERRPLRPEQIAYAALDAYVLLELYDYLRTAAGKMDRPVNLEPPLSLKWLQPSRNERRRAKACRKAQQGPSRRPLPRLPDLVARGVGDLRVVVDSSLVGLGHQLRMCGVDVRILEDTAPHCDIIQISLKEDRIALSVGAPFPQIEASEGQDKCYEVRTRGLRDQVLEVLTAFNVYLTADDIFSRCQTCNGNEYITLSGERMQLLHQKRQLGHLSSSQRSASCGQTSADIAAEFTQDGINYDTMTLCGSGVSVQVDAIPLPVLEKTEEFYVCSTCGKVFWRGSHYDRVCDQFHYVLSARSPPETLKTGLGETESSTNMAVIGDVPLCDASASATSGESSWQNVSESTDVHVRETSGERRTESREATASYGTGMTGDQWVGGVDSDSDSDIDGFYFD